MFSSRLLVTVVVGLAFVCPAAGAECCLQGDVNGDLSINQIDLPLFAAYLLDPSQIPPGRFCAVDANRDAAVDGRDVAVFTAILIDPSLALFEYGPPNTDAEAEQIALETLGPTGPLLAPPATYNRIDRDLDLIRQHTPALATETHSPEWLPNQLIVAVIQGQPPTRYNCLNTYYRMIDEDFLFQSGGNDWYVLTFAGNLNVEALAQIYVAAPEIQYAEPNGLIGGSNFWRPLPQSGGVWRWDIDDGFWDCFDGCDCHRYYVFETTDAGGVQLISYLEQGQPWCKF